MIQQSTLKVVDATNRRETTGMRTTDAPQFSEDDNFERVQAIIDRLEGGFTLSPDEPGGASNMGISRETLALWRAQPVSMDDLRTLTREEAHQIYRATFWDKLGGDRLPLPLALMAYNLSVMSGLPRGITLLQRALNAEGASLQEDGVAGSATVAAAADADVAATVEQFAQLEEDFHRASSNKQYLSGWLNRLADVKETALSWAEEMAKPEPAPAWPELPVPGDVVSAGSSGPLVESLQKSLIAHGYYLGEADGIFGHLTTAAVLAFQADNGLPTTGVVDRATWASLDVADQRPLSLDRLIATANDLLGSRTIAGGKNTRTVGIISTLLGALGLGNSAVPQIGANQPAVNAGKTVTTQADVIGALNQIEMLLNNVKSLPKAQIQDQINQILKLSPKQLSLPDLTQTFQKIENSAATVPNNQDLLSLLHQLESINSGAQNVISNGNTQQLVTSGLELAANFLLPGVGGSLAALGIGLAASFLGNRVINNRMQDHVTGRNTGR
jgi:lysozyme family protein